MYGLVAHGEQPSTFKTCLCAQFRQIAVGFVFVGELDERDTHTVVAFYERGSSVSLADVFVQFPRRHAGWVGWRR